MTGEILILIMLILFALILRGVSFEFRGKVENSTWRAVWDSCFFIGSFLPALLFGVAFGNIFQGIAFDGEGIYRGTLFTLLNPYGLLAGVLFLLLFLEHGALWLCARTGGSLNRRAATVAKVIWPILLIVAVIFLVSTAFATRLYDNYLAHPALFIVILATVAGLLGIRVFLAKGTYFKAWFSSALAIVGATFFGVIGLFPTLFPSSLDSAYDLTAHNASSSPLTLKIMLTVVIIFVPIVLIYQTWAYNLFKKKITPENLAEEGVY
jgi:cytochrome d ubiquinol oxidase subunit II